MGEIKSKKFALLGKPIAASRSPAMHNNLFAKVGLPHEYGLLETDNARDVYKFIRSPDFGGASVTVPLKLDIMPWLDENAPEADIIGAVNTIVSIPSPPYAHDRATRLIVITSNRNHYG